MANKKYKEVTNPFKWKHATGDVILWLVRWYSRYALSYRDLKEIAAERGLNLDHSTIYRWVQEYAPQISNRIKPHLKMTGTSWKIDETYIKIKGTWRYLYRAIDKLGNTLDWMLSRNRNKHAAKIFFKKIISNAHTNEPSIINVDKNPIFPIALNEFKRQNKFTNKLKLRTVKYLNNMIENDYKFTKYKSRYLQWYQSYSTAKNTLDGIEAIRMVQKDQVCHVGKDIIKQIRFIRSLFEIAA